MAMGPRPERRRVIDATSVTEKADDMVCVGVVTGAHGVRGEVRIKAFTEDPAAVAAYGPVRDDAGQPLRLTLTGASSDRVLARIKGIGDRTAAEALKGRRLFVPRSALPAVGADEFYHVDLVGLAADLAITEDTGGETRRLGTVRAVHDHGGGASLEVVTADGGDVLVPFTRAAVPVVDLAAGRVVIAALPGLFDDTAADT